MSSERTKTRDRMVVAAAESLRRHGVAGTSFTEVLAGSGGARGAIYHHFPGGKAELVREAIELTGANVGEALAMLPAGPDESAVVDAFLALVRPVVLESAAGAGCAVAAVVNESAPGDYGMHDIAASVLAGWAALLRSRLEAAGASSARAEQLATLLLTTLEGAHVLCRAAGEIGPFDRATEALRAGLQAA